MSASATGSATSTSMLKPRQRLATRPADAAEADDADRGLVQPAVEQAAPGAGAHAAVVLDDPVRRGRDQRHGVVGHGVVVGAERHGHGDAVPGRGGDVDLVVADAEPGHRP